MIKSAFQHITKIGWIAHILRLFKITGNFKSCWFYLNQYILFFLSVSILSLQFQIIFLFILIHQEHVKNELLDAERFIDFTDIN